MNDINEAKMIKKLMKKDFNKLGFTLLMQTLIAYGVVFLSAIIVGAVQVIINPNMNQVQMQRIFRSSNFLGATSITSVIIAFIPILIYRRNHYCLINSQYYH